MGQESQQVLGDGLTLFGFTHWAWFTLIRVIIVWGGKGRGGERKWFTQREGFSPHTPGQAHPLIVLHTAITVQCTCMYIHTHPHTVESSCPVHLYILVAQCTSIFWLPSAPLYSGCPVHLYILVAQCTSIF